VNHQGVARAGEPARNSRETAHCSAAASHAASAREVWAAKAVRDSLERASRAARSARETGERGGGRGGAWRRTQRAPAA